jgi:DNA-damage-inducible protein J
MAELTSLNIKIDRDLKKQADILFNAMGMNLTTAVNVFVRQAVQEQAIPFRIHVDDSREIALSAKAALKEARAQAVINGTATMTMDEINAEIQAYRKETRG